MAGLVPAIHVLFCRAKGVDARHKAGHDADRFMIVARLLFRLLLVPFAASVAICVAMLFVIAAHWNRFVALAGTNPAPPDDAAFFLLLLAPALVMSAAVVGMLAPAAIGALIAE